MRIGGPAGLDFAELSLPQRTRTTQCTESQSWVFWIWAISRRGRVIPGVHDKKRNGIDLMALEQSSAFDRHRHSIFTV
jgi:hypothetical protein